MDSTLKLTEIKNDIIVSSEGRRLIEKQQKEIEKLKIQLNNLKRLYNHY